MVITTEYGDIFGQKMTSHLLQTLAPTVNKTYEELESEINAQLLRNPDVQKSLISHSIDNARQLASVKRTRVINIMQKLSSSQQARLQDSFSMFTLDFRKAVDSGPHAFSRAHRECERNFCLNELGFSGTSLPVNGYDVCLKDIGGNPLTYLGKEFSNVHTCFPLFDVADACRHNYFGKKLRSMPLSGMSEKKKKIFRSYVEGDSRSICYKPSQYCDIKSMYVMFLHSIYNITNQDLAAIMYKSGALYGYGCFIFDPIILVTNQGQLEHLECNYLKFFRGTRMFIRFWFENDVQQAYEHLYSDYIQLIRTRSVVYNVGGEKHYYLITPREIKNSVLFFSVDKCIEGTVPRSFSTIVYTCDFLKDKLLLYTYSWNTIGDRLRGGCDSHMRPLRIIVPKRMFDNLYSYALVLPDGKLTIKNLMTAAMTFNTREIIRGQSVSDFQRMDPREVQHLVYAIFYMVYVSQYEGSKTLSQLLQSEEKVRKFENRGCVSRFVSGLLSGRGDRVSYVTLQDIAVDSVECNETNLFRRLWEEFLGWVRKTSHADRDYECVISDTMCRFITIGEELDVMYAERGIYDRGTYNSEISELISPEMIFEVMKSELPSQNICYLSEIDFVESECSEPDLKIVPNYSNGDCIYESLRDLGVTSEAVDQIRARLCSSSYLDELLHKDECLRNLLSSSSPSNYGDENNFLLIAKEYKIRVCIHRPDLPCMRFGCGVLFHFAIANGHCQALKRNYLLPSVWNSSLESGSGVDSTLIDRSYCEGVTSPLISLITLREEQERKYNTHLQSLDCCILEDKKKRTFVTTNPYSFVMENYLGYSCVEELCIKEALVRSGLSFVTSVACVVNFSIPKVFSELSVVRKYLYLFDTASFCDDCCLLPVSFEVTGINDLPVLDNIERPSSKLFDTNHDMVEGFLAVMLNEFGGPSTVAVDDLDAFICFETMLCLRSLKPGFDALFVVDFVLTPVFFVCLEYLVRSFEKVELYSSSVSVPCRPLVNIVCHRRLRNLEVVIPNESVIRDVFNSRIDSFDVSVELVDMLEEFQSRVYRLTEVYYDHFSVSLTPLERVYQCEFKYRDAIEVLLAHSVVDKRSEWQPCGRNGFSAGGVDGVFPNVLSDGTLLQIERSWEEKKKKKQKKKKFFWIWVSKPVRRARLGKKKKISDVETSQFGKMSCGGLVFTNSRLESKESLVLKKEKGENLLKLDNGNENENKKKKKNNKEKSKKKNFFSSVVQEKRVADEVNNVCFEGLTSDACGSDGFASIRDDGSERCSLCVDNRSYNYGTVGGRHQLLCVNDVDDIIRERTAAVKHPFEDIYPSGFGASSVADTITSDEYEDCCSIAPLQDSSVGSVKDLCALDHLLNSCPPYGTDCFRVFFSESEVQGSDRICGGGSVVEKPCEKTISSSRGYSSESSKGLLTAVGLHCKKILNPNYGNCRDWEDSNMHISVAPVVDPVVIRSVDTAVKNLLDNKVLQVASGSRVFATLESNGSAVDKSKSINSGDEKLGYSHLREMYPLAVQQHMEFEPSTPSAHAQHEFLSYLKSTYECVLGEVRTFYERCVLMHSNLDTAIREWPGCFGIYDVVQSCFVVPPKNYGGKFVYQKFFSADCRLFDVSEMSMHSELDFSFEFRARKCVIVNEYCLHGYDLEMFVGLVAIYKDDWQLPVDSHIIQAGPGTGKTTYIIREHSVCTAPNPSTVILATREGCGDFRSRVAKNYGCEEGFQFRQYYRTLASYLINKEKAIPTQTMYVDEALMSHPGAIFFCVQLCGASVVRLLGDTLQIPFVNRTPSFVCKYLQLTSFLSISEVLDVSYRCPLDVAWRFHPNYLTVNKQYGIDKGLRSANYNTQSVVYIGITGIQDVPIVNDVKYLTFTQSEKEVLSSLGCDVSTVHEYQGKEFETIYLVRINPYPQESIFLNFNYVLVALTRHKRKCRYYTRVTTDLVSEVIGINEVVGGNIASDTEMSQLYVDVTTRSGENEERGSELNVKKFGKVGGLKSEWCEEDTAFRSVLYSVEKHVPNLSYVNCLYRNGSAANTPFTEVHFVPSFGRYKMNSRHVMGAKGVVIRRKLGVNRCSGRVNDGISNEYVITIESSSSPERNPSLRYINQVLLNGGVDLKGLNIGRIALDKGSLYELELNAVVAVLWKNFHAPVVVYSSEYIDQLESEVFSLLNVNATIEPPDPVMECVYYCYPMHTFVNSIPFSMVLSLCQRLLDEVFSDQSYVDQKLDAWLVHSSDLVLFSGGYQFSSIKGVYRFPLYDNMSPTLKTPMYPTRSVTSREVRIALEKRNLAVPQLSGYVDASDTSKKMLDSLITNCFDASKLKTNNYRTLGLSGNDVHDWLRGQEVHVVDQIVPDFPLHKRAIDNYMYSIKRCPKPNLTIDAAKSYAALQTIVYHEKDINALFCTQFRKIKSRIMNSLLPHIKIFCDMSPAEFADELTKDIDKVLAVFSGDDSYISDGHYNMEIDISKYDKSQGLLALEFDCLVLEYFGMPAYLVELWYYGHVLTYVYDRATSVKCMIPFQRKSGDASTFILNTVFLMGVISNEIPLRELSMIRLEDYVDPAKYACLYNLEVKFFTYDNPYFCSKFLLRLPDRWVFCPDPLKLLVKLGRNDLVNPEHVECYRQSFADSVKVYRDYDVCYYVSIAMQERYKLKMDVVYLLVALPKLSTMEEFSELYTALVGDRLDYNRKYFARID
uniref:Replicase protein n=1 Tax=Aphis glycines nege-like virus 1 iso AG1 TaxID=2961856 RepID=A0A976RX80_9VIRU|nr:replicase protein [Aphis glycines nege-like virus 1 iso AG1]